MSIQEQLAKADKSEIIDQMLAARASFRNQSSFEKRVSDAVLYAEKAIGKQDLTEAELKAARDIRFAVDAMRAGESEIGQRLQQTTQLTPEEIVQSLDANELTEQERRFIYGLDEELGYTVKEQTRYRRFFDMMADSEAAQAFKNPLVRKGAYAIAALALGGFIYSSMKDRTEDDASGPALLPGGSAYEQMPQRQMQVPDGSNFLGRAQGLNYNVNLSGSQEQIAKFRSMANSVSGGPVNTTMYNGLPQLGKDPYSEIASRF